MFSLVVRNQMKRTLGRGLSSSLARPKDHQIDPLQELSMNEKCFLVDESDKIIGQATKRECHRIQPDRNIPLHRAFSVFVFNKKGDLLLQKRSSLKVTYPDHYTNSCCSHPIANGKGEDEEKDAIGIKRAAQRRLNYELGIPTEMLPLDKFEYLTRIHYKHCGDGQWGEHEIDYVLFLQGDLKFKPNSNEISMMTFIPRDQLESHLPTLEGPLTPWFQLILKHRLRLWWDNLDRLNEYKDHKNILRLGEC